MVGNHKLHPNCYIISAGNLETDNAVVNPMSTALKSRLISLTLDVDPDAWLQWAENNGIDYRITSYIRYQKNNLHDFDPEKTDCSYACPRSWNLASNIMKNIKDDITNYTDLFVGTVGNIAYQFVDFCKNIDTLPSMESILNGTASSDLDLGSKYLVVGSILNNADQIKTNEQGTNVTKYLDDIGRDFSIIFYKGCFKKNPNLMTNKAVSSKLKDYAVWLQM